MNYTDEICTVYPENDYRYYLMHHGVKGQKWGVRRYQNEDGSLTALGRQKLKSDGVGFRARTKIRLENIKNTMSEKLDSTKKAKGFVKKASALVGHDAAETAARNRAFTEKRLAKASRTDAGKHYHNVNSENERYEANYHKKIKNMKAKQRVSEFFVPVQRMSTPVRTIDGRKSTWLHEREMDDLRREVRDLLINQASSQSTKYVDHVIDSTSKHGKNSARRKSQVINVGDNHEL